VLKIIKQTVTHILVLKDYFHKLSFILSRFPGLVTGCGGHDFVLLCCIFESIKNPNKTAVKLFLLPYDLTRMEPGTKTSIRQRCFWKEPTDDPRQIDRDGFGA
jgi:hypothetical protein